MSDVLEGLIICNIFLIYLCDSEKNVFVITIERDKYRFKEITLQDLNAEYVNSISDITKTHRMNFVYGIIDLNLLQLSNQGF